MVSIGRPRISPKDRLALYGHEEPNGCITWTGAKTKDGYGKVTVPRDRIDWSNGLQTMHAHRLAYEVARGSIPEGLTLDHLCRNRLCINVDHLEPVSVAENILRGVGAAATNSRKHLCKQGHPLEGSNLYVSREGFRYCRECRRKASREYQRRRRSHAYR